MPPPNEKYLPERLPPAAQRAIEGTAIEAAESIARRCHEAVRPDQAREFTTERRIADRKAGYFAVNRIVRPSEEATLRKWAQDTSKLLEAKDFERRWEEQGRKGESEHAIYFDPSTNRWFKVNNLCNHGNWLEFFHRMALLNWLFLEAPLHFEGLMEFDGQLLPLISQPHVVGIRGASQSEIDHLMFGLGFEPIRRSNSARQYDYINRVIGIEVNDLHDENVIISEDGEPTVIDPVPMMEQESKIRRVSNALV